MKVNVTVRMFIDAALQFTSWTCEDCKVPLEHVWIGDDNDPTLHYLHCPKCQREYSLMILFLPDKTEYKE